MNRFLVLHPAETGERRSQSQSRVGGAAVARALREIWSMTPLAIVLRAIRRER